jgi:hypothetical protein
VVGRPYVPDPADTILRPRLQASTIDSTKTRRGNISSTSGSYFHCPLQPMRLSFTRSKSPLPPPQDINGNDASPPFRRAPPIPSHKKGRTTSIFPPPAFYLSSGTPLSEKVCRFYIDSSKACGPHSLEPMVFATERLPEHNSEMRVGCMYPDSTLAR